MRNKQRAHHYLLWLIIFSTLFVQPLKIFSALSGFNLIQAQICVPIFFSILFFGYHKKLQPLRAHAVLLATQILLWSILSFKNGFILNQYTFFYFFTPHYLITFFFILINSKSSSLLINSFSIYVFVILAMCIWSMMLTPQLYSIDNIERFLWDSFSRSNKNFRGYILDGMNFSNRLFGAPEKTLKGVALTVFPLVLLGILFIRKWKMNLIAMVGMFSAIALLFLKNSRGEMLFLASLLAYPIILKIQKKNRFFILLVYGLGFVQFLLAKNTLNGRDLLNSFFLKVISVWGQGVGFSANHIGILTNQDYASFHNVHLELITNFGLFFYAVSLLAMSRYLTRGYYDRTKHYVVCTYLILMTTNFELFDFYFCIPLAFGFAEKFKEMPDYCPFHDLCIGTERVSL